MATTPNLLITHLEQSQSNKEVTINEGFNALDRGIAGALPKAITSADVTLTNLEAQNAVISLSGTLTGNRNLIVPARSKIYLIYNGTAGAFSVTVKTAAGSGVVIDQGTRQFVYCDGTNVVALTGGSSSVVLADFKDSCRAATTANITLSGAQTIDGVSVIAGDRVLVKDQTTGSQNGIYVAASGAWSRAADFDANSEVTAGCVIPIEEGTVNGDKLFILTTNNPITVGGTSLSFAIISAGGGTIAIEFVIDGGGSAITTGQKGHLEIPFACTITEWTLLADQSGSIVVDIWKDTYANFPPTGADSITASAKPTISSAQKGQSSTLTGWTTTINAGDILAFNVDSIATIQRVTLSLKVTKS